MVASIYNLEIRRSVLETRSSLWLKTVLTSNVIGLFLQLGADHSRVEPEKEPIGIIF